MSEASAAATEEPKPADTSAGVAERPGPTPTSRGIDLLTGPEGDILGFAISPAAQVHAMVDRLLASPRVIGLPTAERYAVAGKVAAVPTEHPRLVERLAAAVATSAHEAGALNALYLLEICKDLVPGFMGSAAPDRLAKAAELSTHDRVKAAVLDGQKPPEWEHAAQQAAQATVVLLPQEEEDGAEDRGLIYDCGRAMGDATKFVGGAALGGVGLVTDTLGLTRNAEDALMETAEEAVDIVGDGANAVVDSLTEGLGGTAEDLRRKGVVGAVGDGLADAADMVSDFVGDAVGGIADGVHGVLSWATGEDPAADARAPYATHKLVVVVAELFGQERTLGLRIENRVITKFTHPDAEGLGWRLGDCLVGVGAGLVRSQEELLAAISAGKEALRTSGAEIRFLVERLGPRPA